MFRVRKEAAEGDLIELALDTSLEGWHSFSIVERPAI